MNGEGLEEVDPFKYLRSTPPKDGTSIHDVKIRQASEAIEKQNHHFCHEA